MTHYLSHSAEETETFAQQFAATLKSGDLIAFQGPMGAGKTAFVRGLCRGLGLADHVSSPTFALVHQYGNGEHALFHFDMFRVTSYDDLYSTGFFDYLDYGGILAIEWSEKIAAVLPPNTITITLLPTDTDPDQREITVSRGA